MRQKKSRFAHQIGERYGEGEIESIPGITWWHS